MGGEPSSIEFSPATGSITGCTLSGVFISCDNGASPTITNNTISGVSYPIHLADGASPVISGNVLGGSTHAGIEISGSISRDWTLANYGLPYYATGNLTISTSGVDLVIAGGNTVTFVGSSCIRASSVTSTIQASGVTFVDAAGEPSSIEFSPATGSITGCTLSGVFISCDNGASPTITNNTISGVLYPIHLADGASPVISGNVLGGSTHAGIEISGSISRDWTLANYGLPYYATGNLTISTSGVDLVIAGGNTVTFVGSSYIRASSATSTIQASGVTFVDAAGEPSSIEFSPATGSITGCTLSGVFISCDNGASPTITNNTISGVSYPIHLADGASPVISGNVLGGSTHAGIEISGSISRDWTLANYGLPYYATGNLTISTSGVDLVIAGGNTVTFVGSSCIRASSVTSTIQASGVTFVDGGGEPSSIELNNGNHNISGCRLYNVKLIVSGSSSASIVGNAFFGDIDCIEINGTPALTVNQNDFFCCTFKIRNPDPQQSVFRPCGE